MEMDTKRREDSYLIDCFLKDCSIRGLEKNSVDSYKYPLKTFKSFFDEKRVSICQIDRDAIRDYIAYLRDVKSLKQKTIENHFSALSSFYQYLVWEERIDKNIILEVRQRYLRTYKKNSEPGDNRISISVEQMSILINSIMNIRDKAMALVFAKTGVRRMELVRIDIDDINWIDNSILLKPTAKRTNRDVFFDGECAMVLRRWLKIREEYDSIDTNALFIGDNGYRLMRSGVYNSIRHWATKVGLYDENSTKIADRFSVHFFRHWNTTNLLRNGMPREYVKELRGDARKEAIDIYDHIDREDLRKKYLAAIPQLNVY
jgi:integrase/recombinase XerD